MLARLLGALLVWACLGLPAGAAIAVNSEEPAHVAQNVLDTDTLTWSFTNTSGTLLCVGANATVNLGGTGATVVGVTYAGAALSEVTGTVSSWGGTPTEISIWCLSGPATGANTVSISALFGGAPSYTDLFGAAISFTGAGSSPGNGTQLNMSTGSWSSLTTNVTGTMSGSLILSMAGGASTDLAVSGATVNSAVLDISTFTAGDNFAMGRQTSAGGTVAPTFTQTSAPGGIAAIEIFAASSGATIADTLPLMGVGRGGSGSGSAFTSAFSAAFH